MPGKFVIRSEVTHEVLDWGQLRWLCNPPSTEGAAIKGHQKMM